MFSGLPGTVRESASSSVIGGDGLAAIALLAIAAVVVVVAAILLLGRYRRRSAEQHLGETFTAGQFTALCDNMSWYGRSAAGPSVAGPPVAPAPPAGGPPQIPLRPEFAPRPEFRVPPLPAAQPPAGRHAGPSAS
jgi:hypothetical protein